MAEENKQFIDEAGGKALADGLKQYVDDNAQPKGNYATKEELPTDYLTDDDLEGYAKSSEVSESISTAIAASEKKIFGEGALAEAFDTIKEIGDYLENHDDVAAGLTVEIGKKVDQETYNSDKEGFETKQNAAATYETKESAEATYETKANAAATYQPKGDYLTEENLPTAVPVSTIQAWFN